MKKRWIYIVLIILVIAGGIFIGTRNDKPDSPESSEIEDDKEEVRQEELPEENQPGDETQVADIEIGQKLPDFELENLAGEKVTLRELEGKIVLVNFWATWCTWCDKEMPDLQKLEEENEDLKILAVNVDETKKEAQTYIDEGGYNFEVLLDEGGEVFTQYLGTGLPASYFIDEEGFFIGRYNGMMTLEQMNETLESIRNM